MQRVTLELSNPHEKGIEAISCEALISAEQPGLTIPQEIALRLRLEKIDDRNLSGSDGGLITVPQVGPVNVKAGKHCMICSSLVWGKDIRIGTTLLSALGWEEIAGAGWIFTDKSIRIPTILPPKDSDPFND